MSVISAIGCCAALDCRGMLFPCANIRPQHSSYTHDVLQIWVPLLQKAFAVHAGGWDELEGGSPVVALPCLTGCLDIYHIRNQAETLDQEFTYIMWQPDYDAYTANSFCGSVTLCDGFNDGTCDASAEVLFEHLCEWDAKNFIVCAGTGGRPGGSGSHDNDSEGICDSHVRFHLYPGHDYTGASNKILV